MNSASLEIQIAERQINEALLGSSVDSAPALFALYEQADDGRRAALVAALCSRLSVRLQMDRG